MRKRYLFEAMKKDLTKKMIFIEGPRQIGKTSLSLHLSGLTKSSPGYLNWDIDRQRLMILKNEWPRSQKTLIFDELHKYKKWRNWIKGNYDRYHPESQFIVTGSARLDYYRKGGDSLDGRYFYFRLHPLTWQELKLAPGEIQTLMAVGGFPEPCLKGEKTFWRRWNRTRTSFIVREDVRDLENVRDLSMIELLMESLSARVGSPLSVESLREELQVAHETVEKWLQILENLYVCYRILPLGAPKIRAVKKNRKLYLWDWAGVENAGAKFENLVASHLLKYCHFQEDFTGHKMELRFLRDIDGREVDFVVLKDSQPLFAVECKTGERSLNRAISYFRERTKIPKFYQVHLGKRDFGSAETDGRVLPFHLFCKLEGLV